MVIDFQATTIVEGVVSFPEWAFTTQPKPDSEMHETVLITGSSSNSQSVTGSVDTPQ